jgi:hypothetical protein
MKAMCCLFIMLLFSCVSDKGPNQDDKEKCALNLSDYPIKGISMQELNLSDSMLTQILLKTRISEDDYCNFFQDEDIPHGECYLVGQLRLKIKNIIFLLIYEFSEGKYSTLHAYSYTVSGDLVDRLLLAGESYEEYSYSEIEFGSLGVTVFEVKENYETGQEWRTSVLYEINDEGKFQKK